MRYQVVKWIHAFLDEPVELYSEIDESGDEVRKVEAYRGGRLDWADGEGQTGTTMLSEKPMPTLDDVNAQIEFVGREVSSEEFERIWARARKGQR